ncbi:hypothetical protein PCK2_000616 [Pneumocystis canis]|nr:hypothetical protein PCK2_000616 [Pneumocystis canis]
MDFVCYEIDNVLQFWEELNDILFSFEKSQKYINLYIKIFLNFTTIYGVNKYLIKDEDYELCCYKFLNSNLFLSNKDYIRHQLITMINDQDKFQYLHILYWILFSDAQLYPETYKLMKDKGSFESLIITIWKHFQTSPEVHRLGLKLIYEICHRYQLTYNELFCIQEEFLCFMFELVEKNPYLEDLYTLSIIKFILVINHQYILQFLPSHLQHSLKISKHSRGDSPVNFVMDILKKKSEVASVNTTFY